MSEVSRHDRTPLFLVPEPESEGRRFAATPWSRPTSGAGELVEQGALLERRRIAQEVHDLLGHHLTAAYLQLEAALSVAATDPKLTRDYLLKAQGTVADTLHEVRVLVGAVRQGVAGHQALVASLQRLADNCAATMMLPVHFAVSGAPHDLPVNQSHTLYRAVEEALTDICRHAGADEAHLRLNYERDATELTVKDDGVGTSQLRPGMGITGMQRRAEALGGALHIFTAPGAGSRAPSMASLP